MLFIIVTTDTGTALIKSQIMDACMQSEVEVPVAGGPDIAVLSRQETVSQISCRGAVCGHPCTMTSPQEVDRHMCIEYGPLRGITDAGPLVAVQ